MGEVEEERVVFVFADKVDSSFGVSLSQQCLVGLLLGNLLILHQWQGRPEVPAVEIALPAHIVTEGDAEIMVEAVAGRQEFRLVTAVPLADVHRRVAAIFQQGGDCFFFGVQAKTLAGEQDNFTLE